ncbi:MAG: hypothetical protein B6U76_11015 [Desulfurococcales archaeon ex4484_217_2]|nr:MAG: hypothetical protein B6U76_11015 [Desulfurococcales archaeon ex4484_217_2]
MAKAYTIGHSNRQLDEFIELLKQYNIKIVVDVRRFPKSTKYPHFNREILEQELKKHSVKYVWLGDLLGGFRKGGYVNYMSSRDYMEGIGRLMSIIFEYDGRTAIMCSEKLWFKCHRRFISDTLVSRGVEIYHIIDRNRVSKHRLKRV